MTPNISEYTFEKLVKYNSSNVSELVRKLEIEIKSLELEIQYRLIFRNKANSFTRPIIPRGTKSHPSSSKSIFHKYLSSYEAETRYKQNQLTSLKDEKQRVLLNQSLRGIEHDNNVKFTPFVFTSETVWNSSYSTSKLLLDTETGKLISQLLQWRNEQVLQEKIIAEELKKQLLAAKIQSEKIIIPKVVIPKVVIPKVVIPATIPAIDPAVLPSIVATSSLIPLGILAILLINSSRGKK
tara:strand:+ start:93 stop:809 length:717 start_codon:yes stop_codon:yes gene_type:complete